jgi:general secretion pathway protein B
MSYILDALRKAERERGAARVPTLTTVHEFRAMQRNRLLAAAGGAVLFGAATVWFFWGPRIAFVARTAPAQSLATTQSGVGSEARGDSAVASTAAPSVPMTEAPTPRPMQEDFVRSATAPVQQPAPLPRVAVPPAPQAASVNAAALPDGALHSPAGRSAAAQPQQPGFAAANVASLPPASEAAAPVSLHQASSAMSVSLLMYAEAEAERIVFINGRKYVKGDLVDGLYLVDSITPEGVVLTHQRERVILRPPAR